MSKQGLFYLYAFSILLVMCATNNLLFTWFLPKGLVSAIGIVVPLLYISNTKCDLRKTNLILCFIWGIICLYQVVNRGISSVASLSSRLGMFMCVASVIVIPMSQKKELLRYITKGIAIIVAISLPPWILHLLGVPLPHSKVFLMDDGVHWVTNYYFFLAGDEYNVLKFPRFRGLFVEGGQCAPVCVFLYFANMGVKLGWQKVVFLTALILSFSLAGYVSFTICYILYSVMIAKRYKLLKTSLFFVFVISSFTYVSVNEKSPFNELIIQRLAYDDEKGIAGNNRTTEYAELRFLILMNSSDRYFGLGRELAHSEDKWTDDSSGIKKFILWNGLIGTFLVFLFVIMLVWYNRCPLAVVLGLCAIMNFIVRDLLLSPMWITIVILGIFVLFNRYIKEENKTTCTVVKNKKQNSYS